LGVIRGEEAAFAEAEYAGRVAKTRAALAARGLAAAVFTSPENIFYLTGQQTPGYYTFQCLILPAEGEPRFLLRQLELNNFLRNTRVAAYQTYDDGARPLDLLVAALRHVDGPVAIEKGGWFLPISFYDALREAVPGLQDATGIVEMLRRVKSPAEIAALDESARQADAGILAGLAAVKIGASENDVVAEMMRAAIAAGAEYMGMEPLVSSGPRAGVPHATWRRRVLERGDSVFLEMSGCFNRYHTGLMRTAWLGEPPDLAWELEAVVQEALASVLDFVKPGVTCAQAHQAVQSVIDRAGMTERYRKRSGYSLGISFAPDWGEWQVLSLFDGIDVPLEPGMCFHVPTTLREYGVFTIGLSESIAVTETGCRILGRVPREVRVVR
jgi:Xaa-Pro dipeptidase